MDQGKRVERQQPEQTPPTQRQRRSRKGGKIFSNPWIFLLFIFGISAILAALCWTAANDVLALNKTEHRAAIIISEEDSFSSVVNQLEEKGIIEYKTVFRIFSFFVGAKGKIAPGAYGLDTEMDYRAIINSISANSDKRMSANVVIPEGYNIDQIFAQLEKSGVSTVARLQETAANHNYNFSFLTDLALGDYHRLEGFLFPDTYEFYMGEDALYVLNKMLVNFDAKVTDDMRQKITDSGYTLRELVTIASMIEKETDGEDRTNISSVIRNRLNNPTAETAGYLQIDATIQYVLPEGEYVTTAHYYGFENPYNTYLNKGLPPGPIANPGMESIVGAMNPANNGYYYYALNSDTGKHHFFKTLSEHTAFVNS